MIKKKNISKEDIDTWQKFIKNPSNIIDKDNIHLEKQSNNKRFKFDLHGLSLNEANQKVKEIILMCIHKNYKEILFVTGKGLHSDTDRNVYVSKNLSKLKYSVPHFIKLNLDLSKHILSISPAEKSEGGNGAIIIKLKKL